MACSRDTINAPQASGRRNTRTARISPRIPSPINPQVPTSMLKPSVDVREENGVLVAEFWDCLRLDPTPVQALRSHFDQHLQRGGRPDLVVDLNGVGFAGSAALGGFVGIHKQARKHSGHAVLCNVDPNVREVLRVSKLDTLLPVLADKKAALQSLADSASSGSSPEPKPIQASKPSVTAPSPLARRKKST